MLSNAAGIHSPPGEDMSQLRIYVDHRHHNDHRHAS